MKDRTDEQVAEEVRSWIEWTQRHLSLSEDIPALYCTSLSQPSAVGEPNYEWPPWSDWANDLYLSLPDPDKKKPIEGMEQILRYFANELASDPAHVATRFTALHFCYSAATFESPMKDEEVSHFRRAFLGDLNTLVGLLPVDECPNDWRTIKWEILNSLVIRDWDRAQRLYNYAELVGALNTARILLLRGQLDFLVVFDAGNEKLADAPQWSPEVFDDGNEDLIFSIFESALLTTDNHDEDASSVQKQRILAARYDLEKVLALETPVPRVYGAMLARCCFALGEFRKAAENYQEFVGTAAVLTKRDMEMYRELIFGDTSVYVEMVIHKREPLYIKKDFRPRVLYSTAKSFQLAGEAEKALKVLSTWLNDYPEDSSAFLCVAEVEAQRGRYQEAYRSLKKAVDLNPILERDLKTKLALALGGVPHTTADFSSHAEAFLKTRLEVAELIDSLHNEFWPAYSQLSDEARRAWRKAVTLMHYFPMLEPSQKSTLFESGAEAFAKAVELEPKIEVFGLFRVEVRKDRDLLSLANKGLLLKETEMFASYLVQNGKLTLGSMCVVLGQCRTSSAPIFQRFNAWLQKRHSILLGRLNILRQVVDVRNPATHGEISRE